jgi:hypothetical protein
LSRAGTVTLAEERTAEKRDERGTDVVVTFDPCHEGDVWTEEGELAGARDYNAGHELSVVLTTDRADGWRDGSVLGSGWELAADLGIAYAIVSVPFVEGWPDVLTAKLREQGYTVRHSDGGR